MTHHRHGLVFVPVLVAVRGHLREITWEGKEFISFFDLKENQCLGQGEHTGHAEIAGACTEFIHISADRKQSVWSRSRVSPNPKRHTHGLHPPHRALSEGAMASKTMPPARVSAQCEFVRDISHSDHYSCFRVRFIIPRRYAAGFSYAFYLLRDFGSDLTRLWGGWQEEQE